MALPVFTRLCFCISSKFNNRARVRNAQNEGVCTLCEDYVAVALDYLGRNETQSECIALAEYYVPLFFLQLESLQPEDFCRRADLCEGAVALAEEARQNSCDACHRAVSEVLNKLQDPDAQLDMIATLLKGCKSLKNYEKQCEKLVFEYGPAVLVNDVCTLLHACPAQKMTLLEMCESPAVADS
ncbi:PREDICTED: uncharacterized protein LOC104824518 [Tarenaya hassleriana]|uniref:uncharacterized protein LOC104824518 n=1 Tax=Tarenaya hassleriana TaxID=28532 RepID=UPI00053C4437|nr:PREDICTED: uncharacterized protein LOC104824518 [Tarenaya hassleriana]